MIIMIMGKNLLRKKTIISKEKKILLYWNKMKQSYSLKILLYAKGRSIKNLKDLNIA